MSRTSDELPKRLPLLPPPLNNRSSETVIPIAKSAQTEVTSNRFHQINSFVDCSINELSRSESLTWLVLWRDTKPDGTARTAMADIARRIGSSQRAVVTALAHLQKWGLVTLLFKGGLNRGPSVYQLKPLVNSSG